MRRCPPSYRSVPALPLVAGLLVLSACGTVSGSDDQGSQGRPSASPSSSASSSATPAPVDTSAARGDWLLGLTTAGGADGETSTTVYLRFDPTTGKAVARRMPGVKAASVSPDQAALLVSADRRWAIPDTGISHDQERSGRLEVYSLRDTTSTVIDLRARTGRSDVRPVGWAFDPNRADTLRVVDTRNRVWVVNVAGGRAVQETRLPRGPWIFTNGFNHNTGRPWVESIQSDATRPAGNGVADKSPVTRAGGTVLPSGTPALDQLPAIPCRLSGGFQDAQGTTWVFCADKASLTSYYLPKGGQEWTAVGKPSTPVAPVAAGLPLVLPPAA